MRFAALLVLVGCGGGQTPIENVTVHALRVPCVNFQAAMCIVMQPDFKQPERLFFGISGYTHRWGVEAELLIHREQVDPPLIDGPSERIIVDEIIAERDLVTDPFPLEFPSNSGLQWFVNRPPNLDMVGTVVRCETPICQNILNAQSGFQNFQVTFERTEDPQALTAVSLP